MTRQTFELCCWLAHVGEQIALSLKTAKRASRTATEKLVLKNSLERTRYVVSSRNLFAQMIKTLTRHVAVG